MSNKFQKTQKLRCVDFGTEASCSPSLSQNNFVLVAPTISQKMAHLFSELTDISIITSKLAKSYQTKSEKLSKEKLSTLPKKFISQRESCY